MNKNITDLKNKHKDEDIWIILAGSSMDYISTDFFNNKITIGQNQVYKHYPCNYVVMKDCMEEPRFPRSIEELDRLEKPLIYCEYYKGYSTNQKNVIKHKNSYMFKHNTRQDDLETELYNLRDDEIVVSKSTVTSLMHIAAYMGAKNIILCGHDCGKLNGNLYYEGYMEKDWVSAENWNGINSWMGSIQKQTQLVRKYLMDNYNCNIHSLNPFLNFGLEGNRYEAS
tara:strand:- start:567 stop:1244 length:678 start_codon:yes stop_codon:yes gene_type:complete